MVIGIGCFIGIRQLVWITAVRFRRLLLKRQIIATILICVAALLLGVLGYATHYGASNGPYRADTAAVGSVSGVVSSLLLLHNQLHDLRIRTIHD
jgi:hypothetical protein